MALANDTSRAGIDFYIDHTAIGACINPHDIDVSVTSNINHFSTRMATQGNPFRFRGADLALHELCAGLAALHDNGLPRQNRVSGGGCSTGSGGENHGYDEFAHHGIANRSKPLNTC